MEPPGVIDKFECWRCPKWVVPKVMICQSGRFLAHLQCPNCGARLTRLMPVYYGEEGGDE